MLIDDSPVQLQIRLWNDISDLLLITLDVDLEYYDNPDLNRAIDHRDLAAIGRIAKYSQPLTDYLKRPNRTNCVIQWLDMEDEVIGEVVI